MDNRAGTSLLRASSARCGASEGFSEDWFVSFRDHQDSHIGPGELGSALCPLHLAEDPADNDPFKNKHTEIW